MERRKKFEEAYKSASLERGKQKHIIGGPDFEVKKSYLSEFLGSRKIQLCLVTTKNKLYLIISENSYRKVPIPK